MKSPLKCTFTIILVLNLSSIEIRVVQCINFITCKRGRCNQIRKSLQFYFSAAQINRTEKEICIGKAKAANFETSFALSLSRERERERERELKYTRTPSFFPLSSSSQLTQSKFVKNF